jgi:hypothetical protein
MNSPDPHDGSIMWRIVFDTPHLSAVLRKSASIDWTHDGGVKKIPPFFFSSFESFSVSFIDNSEKDAAEELFT